MEKSKEEIQFNRLVLVGNGFDLALGLKTGYNDFILELLKKYFLQTLKEEPFNDPEGKKYNVGYLDNKSFEIGIKNNYSGVNYEKDVEKIKTLVDFNTFQKDYKIDFKIKSILLKKIIDHSNDLGWVDIESLFYQELKKCIDKEPEDILRLNNELDFLSKELELYLTKINVQPKDWQKISAAVKTQLVSKIKKDELKDESLISEDKLPDILYFLNFNYTKAFYNATSNIDTWRISTKNIIPKWNPIHGQINNSEAPIVFGFGDESDKDYERIENLNKNDFFEHIKSFKYTQTQNYQHLIKFLDSASFQVFIYGHSCGLSDRTMLKEIFEHDKCKSIKVFYYKKQDGSDDFLEKTMEISRHFSDKALMRRKIVNKRLSQPMPQNNS